MTNFNFGPAFENEQIVFGAQRPGHDDYDPKHVGINSIKEWISFMKDNKGIKRICCLLTQKQLDYYLEDLLSIYYREFGQHNVLNAPIEDYHLCDAALLKERIIPFLENSDICGEHVVVHCSGGSGRTGHVLASWLVHKHGLSVDQALSAVENMGRNPREAVQHRPPNATMDQLRNLLLGCQKRNIAA